MTKRVVARLKGNRPPWNFKLKEQELAEEGYSGDALYDKLIDDALDPKVLKLETKHVQCFLAGTLVHTEKGLVPIQDIKVGDKVLSRDENNPHGELAYKRVLNTFASAQKQKIVRVAYNTVKDEVTDARIKEVEDSGRFYRVDEQTAPFYIYCTENHAFWAKPTEYHSMYPKEEGWLSAVDLAEDDKDCSDKDYSLVTHNNRPTFQTSYLTFSTPLVRTNFKDIAIQRDHLASEAGDIYNIIDFSDGKPVILKNVDVPASILFEWWDEKQDHIDLKENPNHRLAKKSYVNKDFTAADNVYFFERGLLDKDGWTNAYKNLTQEERDYHSAKCHEEQYYLATVYNIEVEEYHTYFVGEHGIWVHNTNCGMEKLPKIQKHILNEVTVRNPKRSDPLPDYVDYG